MEKKPYYAEASVLWTPGAPKNIKRGIAYQQPAHVRSLRRHVTGAVDTIPLSVGPEACGLNANALFAYHDGLADRLWRDAAKLYRNVDGSRDGNNNGRDEAVKNVGADILRSLPGPFDVGKVKTFYGDKCLRPNVVVLLRELDKFNALLAAVRDSLSQLAKVIGPHYSRSFPSADVYFRYRSTSPVVSMFSRPWRTRLEISRISDTFS